MATISNLLQTPIPNPFGVQTTTPATAKPIKPLTTANPSTTFSSGLVSPKPPPSSTPLLPNTLTPDQLATQNASRGISQTNTGPATVGGPVGSQDAPTGNSGGSGVNGLFPNVLSSLAQGTAARNAAITDQAQSIASEAGKQIADVGTAAARGRAGYLTTGTTPIAEGNAAVVAQTAAEQQGAIASGANMALQGTSQALTGSGQTASALSSAGTLAQPSQNFPFVFNPSTGTYTAAPGLGGANGNAANGGATPTLTYNPNEDAKSLATLVMGGKMTYQQALQSLSYASGVASPALNSAITSAGGNPLTLQAQGAATQQNITTTGTAGTNAINSVYQGAVQHAADATKAYSSLTGISSQLTNVLSKWQNSGVLTNVNSAVNSIGAITSNPDYTAFVTALGNTQAAYQSILGSAGVTPTKADQDAMNALNPNSSATAIVAAVNQLSQDAHALLVVPAYTQVQQYGSQLGIQ